MKSQQPQSGASPIRDPGDYFKKREIKLIMAAARENHRDWALLQTILMTGRRVSEIVGLRARKELNPHYNRYNPDSKKYIWRYTGRKEDDIVGGLRPKDIDEDTKLINFVILKKGEYKRKPVVVLPQIKEILKNYIRMNNIGYNELVFPISRQRVDQIIKKYSYKVGIMELGENKKPHIHAFRHSFAVHMIQQNMDIRTLQQILYHSDLTTTAHYLQFSQKDIQKTLVGAWSGFMNEENIEIPKAVTHIKEHIRDENSLIIEPLIKREPKHVVKVIRPVFRLSIGDEE